MNTQNRKPRWRQLTLLVPLMMGLLLIDVHLRLSPLEHQMIEVGVVLLMYGSMACWLWANQAALESESEQTGPWQRIAPQAGQTRAETSLPALVGQVGDEHDSLAESSLLDVELQKVLQGPVNHCAPPSGARLN